jgi:kumamolisin
MEVSVVLRHRATDSLKDRVAEVLQAVCGHADPRSEYEVRVDGSDAIIGGTSAVAPLWAGLIARINAAKASPVGSINPAFNRHPGPRGTSSTVATAHLRPPAGWDACSGLLQPNGRKVPDAV